MKDKKTLSYEEFIIHCKNISSCMCCIYAPKEKKSCYNLYCIMVNHSKIKKGENNGS